MYAHEHRYMRLHWMLGALVKVQNAFKIGKTKDKCESDWRQSIHYLSADR